MTGIQAGEQARGVSTGDVLGRLLDRELPARQRVAALRDFAGGWRGWSGGVPQLVERGAELLATAVHRLPIRDATELRASYGADDEMVAQQVIDDAARLTSLLWMAAAALPVPSHAARAITVVVQGAIEIRMVAELYAVYGAPVGSSAQAGLNVVLNAWAVGRPVAVAPDAAAGARDVAQRIRRSYDDLTDGTAVGRSAMVGSRGRAGAELVRRRGRSYQRRMRVHPRMWAQPGQNSGIAVVVGEASQLLAGRRFSTADSHGRHGWRASLATAWEQHALARDGAERVPDDEVRERLIQALTCQGEHLRALSLRLPGAPSMPAPSTAADVCREGDDPTIRVHEHLASAEDAIDDTEAAGARPRRLPGWPLRIRNGLLYFAVTLIIALPFVLLILSGVVASGVGVAALLLLMCVTVPGVAFGLGVVAIGMWYRPWLGGPVPRSPLLGAVVSLSVTVVLATVLAVAAAW
jgi:hypothetical protein